MPASNSPSPLRRHLPILALYTILTVVLTWPLVNHFTTHVPGVAQWCRALFGLLRMGERAGGQDAAHAEWPRATALVSFFGEPIIIVKDRGYAGAQLTGAKPAPVRQRHQLDRVLTHDLMVAVLNGLGGSLRKVIITRVRSGSALTASAALCTVSGRTTLSQMGQWVTPVRAHRSRR